MVDETRIPESHNAPLLLASMGNNSPLKSTVAAMRTKDTNKLTWEDEPSELIQEWNQLVGKQGSSKHMHDKYKSGHDRNENSENCSFRTGQRKGLKCDFCDILGHESRDCFVNPDWKWCKLPDKALDSMKSMLTSKQKDNESNSRIHFNGNTKFKSDNHRCNGRILDSIASTTMLKSKTEAHQGTDVNASEIMYN